MWFEASWKSGIESKSSTKYLNPLVLNFGRSHHKWSTVRANILIVEGHRLNVNY